MRNTNKISLPYFSRLLSAMACVLNIHLSYYYYTYMHSSYGTKAIYTTRIVNLSMNNRFYRKERVHGRILSGTLSMGIRASSSPVHLEH